MIVTNLKKKRKKKKNKKNTEIEAVQNQNQIPNRVLVREIKAKGISIRVKRVINLIKAKAKKAIIAKARTKSIKEFLKNQRNTIDERMIYFII